MESGKSRGAAQLLASCLRSVHHGRVVDHRQSFSSPGSLEFDGDLRRFPRGQEDLLLNRRSGAEQSRLHAHLFSVAVDVRRSRTFGAVHGHERPGRPGRYSVEPVSGHVGRQRCPGVGRCIVLPGHRHLRGLLAIAGADRGRDGGIGIEVHLAAGGVVQQDAHMGLSVVLRQRPAERRSRQDRLLVFMRAPDADAPLVG